MGLSSVRRLYLAITSFLVGTFLYHLLPWGLVNSISLAFSAIGALYLTLYSGEYGRLFGQKGPGLVTVRRIAIAGTILIMAGGTVNLTYRLGFVDVTPASYTIAASFGVGAFLLGVLVLSAGFFLGRKTS